MRPSSMQKIMEHPFFLMTASKPQLSLGGKEEVRTVAQKTASSSYCRRQSLSRTPWKRDANSKMTFHFFISHMQIEASGDVVGPCNRCKHRKSKGKYSSQDSHEMLSSTARSHRELSSTSSKPAASTVGAT